MPSAEIRVLLRVAERQRFSVELRKSGHYRVTGPDGRWTTIPATPRMSRGVRQQITAKLRRIGVAA